MGFRRPWRGRSDVTAGWSCLADAERMRPAVPGEGFHAGKPTDRSDGTAVVRLAFARRTGYSPIEASRLHHCEPRPVKAPIAALTNERARL